MVNCSLVIVFHYVPSVLRSALPSGVSTTECAHMQHRTSLFKSRFTLVGHRN